MIHEKLKITKSKAEQSSIPMMEFCLWDEKFEMFYLSS